MHTVVMSLEEKREIIAQMSKALVAGLQEDRQKFLEYLDAAIIVGAI